MQNNHLLPIVAVLIILLASGALWVVLIDRLQPKGLTVAFLDVGQGDAIFIESPTGRQTLIDGGRDQTVLRALRAVMPFYDRSIDVVVATHPDSDHIGGLLEVLKRFSVDIVMRPGVAHDTPATSSLLASVAYSDVEEVRARRGQVIDLGGGVLLHILFPDRDVSGLDTNDASIIARLTYGEHSFLFTGDTSQAIEEYLVALDGDYVKSDVLKIGHHGSRTSSSVLFVGYVEPQFGILSRGCDNSYGHPHQEVLDTFARFEIEVFDTCTDGTIIFESDGSLLRNTKPN